MLISYMITPYLSLRNYCKYKKFKIELFYITFNILHFYKISFLLQKKYIVNPFMIMIFERWYFLIYKTILSIINNDYIIKKEKYKKKYNLEYLNQ